MNSSTDIAALHDNLVAALTTRFPSAHVGYYERPFDTLPKSPAIYLNLAQMPANDPGTDGNESMECTLHWEAFVVMRYRDPDAKRTLRVLAAQVMFFIRGQRFNLGADGTPAFVVGPCIVGGAYLDEMKPVDNGYEVFRVEWTQEARILADDSRVQPVNTVGVSTPPLIGTPHADDYTVVVPQP